MHGLPIAPFACSGVTYGTTNLTYTEPDTPAMALPPPPTIAHQTESGHDPLQLEWDPMVESTLYEVSTLQHPVGDDTQGLLLGRRRRNRQVSVHRS